MLPILVHAVGKQANLGPVGTACGARCWITHQLDGDPVLESLQGDYGLLNLRAGLAMDEYNLELVGWVRNALDEEYVTSSQPTLLQDGKLLSYYTEPRTYGMTLKLLF